MLPVQRVTLERLHVVESFIGAALLAVVLVDTFRAALCAR